MSIIGTKEVAATIDNGASLSDAVPLRGYSLLRIVMPVAWTAADLSFKMSDDEGATYRNVYWDWGAEMVVAADAARVIELSPFVKLSHVDNIKIRSGTAGTPVIQGAIRELLLVVSTRG